MNRALECRSDFVPALILKDAIQEEERAIEASKQMRYVADDTRPGDWAAAWLSAYRGEQNREWKVAEQAYSELLNVERMGTEFYLGFSQSILLGRGRMRLKAKDLDGALEDFAVACDRWPDLMEPGLLRGNIYLLKKNPDRAEAIFHELFARTKDRDAVCQSIGVIV